MAALETGEAMAIYLTMADPGDGLPRDVFSASVRNGTSTHERDGAHNGAVDDNAGAGDDGATHERDGTPADGDGPRDVFTANADGGNGAPGDVNGHLREFMESQNGFRGGRGERDANSVLTAAIALRRAHGLPTWVLYIDFVKAFDRVVRSLLWRWLARLGVPDKLIRLLKAMQANVSVIFDVGDVRSTLKSIIGVSKATHWPRFSTFCTKTASLLRCGDT